jgi:heme-degrading monooxygenase HmoA
MQQPIYEVVVYSSTSTEAADAARAAILSKVRELPGFMSFLPLVGTDDASDRADIVTWASSEAATAAAQAVGSHPDFASFTASVAKLTTMGYYRAQWASAPAASGSCLGMEVGFFRLRPGVSEAEARAAHAKAVDGYLSHQPGWVAQHFVAFDGGLYLDLLLAETRERAEAICGLWGDHPDCQRFVSLVQDVDMKFGSAVR